MSLRGRDQSPRKARLGTPCRLRGIDPNDGRSGPGSGAESEERHRFCCFAPKREWKWIIESGKQTRQRSGGTARWRLMASQQGGPFHRVFLAKSAEAHETKELIFCKCKRVRKNVKTKGIGFDAVTTKCFGCRG